MSNSALATRAHNPQLNGADAVGIVAVGTAGAGLGSLVGGAGLAVAGTAVGVPALAITAIGGLIFGTAAAIWTQADKMNKYSQAQRRAKAKTVPVQAVVVDEYLESLENDLDNHFQWLASGQF